MLQFRVVYKINTDASVSQQGERPGVGVVIWDRDGKVMASFSQGFNTCYQPQIAEVMVILEGISLAVSTGLLPAVLESDALTVVNDISSQVPLCANVGVVISDILILLMHVNVLSINFCSYVG
ncbi:hypothetical protein Ddye_026625 [Dipteronia dyeriana]|uniref:RNase H type-1 domain-containing protein n=1 Tax=Dipteronia dyeriana TaxID=168575 RepID=A0AAD9TNL1_9ROSI|nr:hypothetical protein Ddye_026625 [Dipteronia dyeriana]